MTRKCGTILAYANFDGSGWRSCIVLTMVSTPSFLLMLPTWPLLLLIGYDTRRRLQYQCDHMMLHFDSLVLGSCMIGTDVDVVGCLAMVLLGWKLTWWVAQLQEAKVPILTDRSLATFGGHVGRVWMCCTAQLRETVGKYLLMYPSDIAEASQWHITGAGHCSAKRMAISSAFYFTAHSLIVMCLVD